MSLTLFRLRINCKIEQIFVCQLNCNGPWCYKLFVCLFFLFLTPIAKLSCSDWRSYWPRHWRRVCFQVLEIYITHCKVKDNFSAWNACSTPPCKQSLFFDFFLMEEEKRRQLKHLDKSILFSLINLFIDKPMVITVNWACHTNHTTKTPWLETVS